MNSRLKNLEHDRRLPIIPITSFLNGKEYKMDNYGEADDYLRPFDIIKANRIGGFFKHVGIYLGKGYVCHFTGSSNSESSGSDSIGMKVIKDTLSNFFKGNEKSHICVTRPIVRFKNREEMIGGIAKAIASEYGAVFKPFTSPYSTILKEEIRECERVISNLASSSNSRVQDLVNEIKDLTQENSQD
ncbi:1040_t:CDS:2, partial [Ambispora gerdemannii]